MHTAHCTLHAARCTHSKHVQFCTLFMYAALPNYNSEAFDEKWKKRKWREETPRVHISIILR